MSLSTIANIAQIVSVVPLLGAAAALWRQHNHLAAIRDRLEKRERRPEERRS